MAQEQEDNKKLEKLINDCKYKMLMYGFEACLRPRQPTKDNKFWKDFVQKYYDPRAFKMCCFSSSDQDLLQRDGFVPDRDSKVVRLCGICWSRSGRRRHYVVEDTKLLHQALKAKFLSSDLVDEVLNLNDQPTGKMLPDECISLFYYNVTRHFKYRQMPYDIVQKGRLRLVFTKDLKILSWEFCGQRVLLMHSLVPPRDYICQWEEGSSSGSQLDKTEPGVAPQRKINQLGFHTTYCRYIEMINTFELMKDLMRFSIRSGHGPVASLVSYGHAPENLRK